MLARPKDQLWFEPDLTQGCVGRLNDVGRLIAAEVPRGARESRPGVSMGQQPVIGHLGAIGQR